MDRGCVMQYVKANQGTEPKVDRAQLVSLSSNPSVIRVFRFDFGASILCVFRVVCPESLSGVRCYLIEAYTRS